MPGHLETAQVLSEPVSASKPEGYVAGLDPVMQSLNRVASDVAGTNISILLTGESGEGKQAHRRHIHRLSGRPPETFQKVQCAALNEARFAEVLAEAGEGFET